MWAVLSHDGHAQSFLEHGDHELSMFRLVERLSQRPYAGAVFAYKSLARFCITTAPSYHHKDGHDAVAMHYHPSQGQFGVIYAEWISATRNPQHRAATVRSCEWPEVVDVVDLYVLRPLLTRRAQVLA